MKKVSGKELRQNTEKAINDLISSLEIGVPSKRTKKVAEKLSRQLSKDLKKQMKKNAKATRKARPIEAAAA